MIKNNTQQFKTLLHEVSFVWSNLFEIFRLIFEPLPKRVAKPETLSILVLNWRDTKHKWSGGAEVYVHELAKRWVAAGHHVTHFCGNDGNNPRNEMIEGIQIIRRGGFYTVYFWAMLYYLFRFRGRYHVIVDCENGIPFFTPIYSMIPKILLVFHVHRNVFYHSLSWGFSHFAVFLESKLMPQLYQKIPMITISPSSKQEIMQAGISLVEPYVLFPGVDLDQYKSGAKAHTPTILFLGRLRAYKRVDLLIRAFAQLYKQKKSTTLVIAGDGEERTVLRELVKKLGISNTVIFKGKVSQTEKIRLMQQAWVFANPSLVEGWGITNIEANACGTPVVAVDSAGLRDSVSHNFSGLLTPSTEKSFANGLLRILDDTYLREKLENGARSWATNFSWDESADKFLEFMHEFVKTRPAYRVGFQRKYEVVPEEVQN